MACRVYLYRIGASKADYQYDGFQMIHSAEGEAVIWQQVLLNDTVF